MGWHEWVNPLNNRLGYLIGLAQNRVSPLSDQKTKFEWVLIFIFLFCIGANGFLDDGSTHLATGWANGFKPMPDTRHRPYSFMDGSNPYPYPNPLTWKTFAPAPFLLFFFFSPAPTVPLSTLPPYAAATRGSCSAATATHVAVRPDSRRSSVLMTGRGCCLSLHGMTSATKRAGVYFMRRKISH